MTESIIQAAACFYVGMALIVYLAIMIVRPNADKWGTDVLLAAIWPVFLLVCYLVSFLEKRL